MMTFAKLSANTWNTSFGSHRKDHKCSKTALPQDIFKHAYSWKLSFVSCKKQVLGGSIQRCHQRGSDYGEWQLIIVPRLSLYGQVAMKCTLDIVSGILGRFLSTYLCPKFWEDYYRLLHTHCQQLLKSVGSHGSLSLLFVMKVKVWHFVSKSHKVMTTLIAELPSNYYCEEFSTIS